MNVLSHLGRHSRPLARTVVVVTDLEGLAVPGKEFPLSRRTMVDPGFGARLGELRDQRGGAVGCPAAGVQRLARGGGGGWPDRGADRPDDRLDRPAYRPRCRLGGRAYAPGPGGRGVRPGEPRAGAGTLRRPPGDHHLDVEETDTGIGWARQALDWASRLRSARLTRCLRAIRATAHARPEDTKLKQLRGRPRHRPRQRGQLTTILRNRAKRIRYRPHLAGFPAQAGLTLDPEPLQR